MFRCKVCVEKSLRIADLKEEIKVLRSLTIPSNDPNDISSESLEADAILSGRQDVITIKELPKDDISEELAERDRILSGTYS